MKPHALRYALLTYRLDQIWLPLGFWALFVIICLFLPEKLTTVARGYLGFVVPLMGGVLAAYAVLDDPALELRFAAPVLASRTLLERLGTILFFQMISAWAFQGFCWIMGENLAVLGGGWWGVQLAWLVPTLALMALGITGALLAAQPMGGALLVGVLWFFQLILRGWLASHTVGRYFLVFMRAAYPELPWLAANEISVAVWAALLLVGAWALLQRQERYL